MIKPGASPALTVNVRRVLRASPASVYRAWTEPAEIRRWFAASEEHTTPIAEVDLRIGGRFRIGMQAPNSNTPSVATGVYQEIVPQARLVFTWRWEHDGPDTPPTRLSLEFRPHPDGTEFVLVSDFNFDYHASFTAQEIKDGTAFYNFSHSNPGDEEVVGVSVFYKDESGAVYHTYSTFARGVDMVNTAYHYLDLVPKGRDEEKDGIQAWVRYHDRYED